MSWLLCTQSELKQQHTDYNIHGDAACWVYWTIGFFLLYFQSISSEVMSCASCLMRTLLLLVHNMLRVCLVESANGVCVMMDRWLRGNIQKSSPPCCRAKTLPAERWEGWWTRLSWLSRRPAGLHLFPVFFSSTEFPPHAPQQTSYQTWLIAVIWTLGSH